MGKEYSDKSFWAKAKTAAKAAGSEVMRKALWLFYAAQAKGTPAWAKTVIYGALAYFILPLDAVPDVIPVAGYTDDLGAIAAALATVSVYVDKDVKEQAEAKMKDWGMGADEKEPD
jgi:uncharacterized membrane protein YkvA (DUF1232 family)